MIAEVVVNPVTVAHHVKILTISFLIVIKVVNPLVKQAPGYHFTD
jgi:hypothetical protein